MPCIMFSEHERQQAAHYLHSTQISGLVSAGISFQVGMNLSIELRLGTPHALVDSSDTQKSLCSCGSSPYTLLLSIWICEICITSQIRGQHANCRKMQRVVRFFFAEMSTCALRRWSPLTSVKVNKSKSFSIFNCVPPMSTPSCLEARCVMLFSQNDFRGRSSGLSLSIFPPFPLYHSLSPSLSFFLRWNDRFIIVSANTKEPRGCDSSPSGLFGCPIRARRGSSPSWDEDVDKAIVLQTFV